MKEPEPPLLRLPFPETPPPGPFRREFWRSPLRGPWLASFLGSALLPLILISAVTGFLSHTAYNPRLGSNGTLVRGPDIFSFDWPTHPSWLYALTQGLHVVCGIVAIPILLAKLWAVIPKLYEWPPARSLAHALERLSLALLVGGAIFETVTGVLNAELYYPWKFSFLAAHYYGAFVFTGALLLHVGLKIPTMRKAYRERGVLKPLRDDLAHTEPEPAEEESTAPLAPRAPTLSRRGLIGAVAAGSAGLTVLTAGQSIGGPFRRLAVLSPHGRAIGDGANDFQINKTAASVGIGKRETANWHLTLAGPQGERKLSRAQLMRMRQSTQDLPIACVEGWSTTQRWTGVPLSDLARLAGLDAADVVYVESLQKGGAFSHTTLSRDEVADSRSLLALQVNGSDLELDHGFPARIIVPALPGVHNTKWVRKLTFGQEQA